MRLTVFMDHLKKHVNFTSALSNLEEEVYTFMPKYPDTLPEPHILYIGTEEDILSSSGDTELDFLCLTDQPDSSPHSPFRRQYPHANFIFLSEGLTKRDIFDVTAGIFLEFNRYNSHIDQLVQAYNSNRGLQNLIRVASTILQSPVIVIDTSYRVLAMHRDASSLDEFSLDEQSNLGYLTELNLERMKRDRIYEELRSAQYHFHYGKASDARCCWVDTLVYVHGIEVAEIGIQESHHTFTHYEFQFIYFLNQVVSWEMQKGNFHMPNRGLMHSILLMELLEQKFAQSSAISRRMRMLGWKETPYFRVFSIFSRSQKNFSQQAEVLALQLQDVLPENHWVITDSGLIFLIFKNDGEIKEFLPESPLSLRLARSKVYGVLSNRFTSLLDVKKYYDQTTDIRDFLPSGDNAPSIYRYEDYSVCHLAKIVKETHDIEEFYHSAIQDILEYDENNHTCYLDTLYEYLVHIDNPTVSARNLCIHKNTFFYRMNKIRELFHLDLDNGIERMRLLLSMEFRKAAPPEDLS